MLWPDTAELTSVEEMLRPAGSGLPSINVVIDTMRPVARAALMMGYACRIVRVGSPVEAGTSWVVIDVEELTSYETTSPENPPHAGVTIELLCDPVVDRQLVVHDDGSIGPPVLGGAGGDVADPGPAVDYSIDGSVRTFVFGSSAPWSGGSPPFAEEISALVDNAVAVLGALHPDSTDLRRPHAGLLWLFDPRHWDRTVERVPGDLAVAAEVIGDPSSFLVDQITAHPSRCSLTQMLEASGSSSDSSPVWRAIIDGLSARGERHRLTPLDVDRLVTSEPEPPWIDVLVWCLRRGVVVIDALLDEPSAVEPIRVVDDGDATISIVVWGDEQIVCTRVHPSGGTIRGGISWDYTPGSSTERPQVIVVASRGIHIACSPAVRATVVPDAGTTMSPLPPWDLQIHRVQHSDLVPPVGGVIDTVLLGAPAHIDEGLSLLIQPKPDGVLLVYPAPPPGQPISGSVYDGIVRDVVELTVNPFSAEDWYELDCHTTTYRWASGGVPEAHALHLVVRATLNVEIATNRAAHSNDNPALQLRSWLLGDEIGEVTGRGIIVSGHPNHVIDITRFSDWSFSAELWRVMEPPTEGAYGRPWDVLERPWVRRLPVLSTALARPIADAPVLGPTRTWQIGDHTVTSHTDGQAELFPAAHVYRQYGYVDSLVFDLIDVVIGFVPFVGDIADAAEVVLAWQTGRDKWGRPVSNFQLALMMIGASVPLVSAGFALRAGETVAAGAGVFRSGPADFLAGSAIPALDGFVEQAAAASKAPRLWENSSGVASVALGRSTQLGDDLFGAIAQNADSVARLADDVVDAAYGTAVRAADLVGDDGGFWMHAFHVPLTRYSRSTGTLISPYTWLDLQATGRLAAVTGAIIHVDPSPVRLIQPRSRFPSAMRAMQQGSATSVAVWSTAAVSDRIQSAIGLITTRAWSGRGVFEGAVRPAAEIITDGHVPIRAEAADLFASGASAAPSLMAAGAAKLADLSASRPGGLAKMLGNAIVEGVELSDDERALRLAKGLYCAALEIEEHGLHALVDLASTSPTALRRSAAETLFTDELAPAVAEFLRQWVNRSIHEHALRFEFRQTAVAEAVLRSADRALLHQLMLVGLDGATLKSGPDTTLFMESLATFLQWKAYQSPVDLFGGRVSADLVEGRWVVKGGDFVQQHITDQLRAAMQGGKVPGPTAELPTGPVSDPSGLVGWVDVSRVSVQVFDDSHMVHTAMTKLAYAAQRKGSKTIDIVEDVTDMPGSMRRFLVRHLGPTYRLERQQVMADRLRSHIVEYVRAQELAINAALQSPQLVAALGRETSVVIRAASEGLDDLPIVVQGRL